MSPADHRDTRGTNNNNVTNVICLLTQCPGPTHGVTLSYDVTFVTWARGEDTDGVSEDSGQ